MKKDLTNYGSSELSLLFNNEQALYNTYMYYVRRDDFTGLKAAAEEMFEYTDEQIEELEEDFNLEVQENA